MVSQGNQMTDTTELHKILIDQAGFQWGELTHLFVGGSAAHGARLGESGDLDLYGIFIEPPERVLGISQYFLNDADQPQLQACDHFIWSTGGNDKRNVDGDIDVNLYGLRKWAGMAASGNSTALEFLFNPNVESAIQGDIWNNWILPHRATFLSAHAGLHFNKFAQNQLDRLMGRKGKGRHGVRPDLVEKYGYDTKFAMHTIRILHEGIELMETGNITLPRPEAQMLIGIRVGKFGTLEELEQYALHLFEELETARLNSPLPPEIDRAAISTIVAEAYLEAWSE